MEDEFGSLIAAACGALPDSDEDTSDPGSEENFRSKKNDSGDSDDSDDSDDEDSTKKKTLTSIWKFRNSQIGKGDADLSQVSGRKKSIRLVSDENKSKISPDSAKGIAGLLRKDLTNNESVENPSQNVHDKTNNSNNSNNSVNLPPNRKKSLILSNIPSSTIRIDNDPLRTNSILEKKKYDEECARKDAKAKAENDALMEKVKTLETELAQAKIDNRLDPVIFWRSFLPPGENVSFTDCVTKKNRYGKKQVRQLILSTEGTLIYVDPMTKVLKGEIEWREGNEPADFKLFNDGETGFTIKTRKKTYILYTDDAARWLSHLEMICFGGN